MLVVLAFVTTACGGEVDEGSTLDPGVTTDPDVTTDPGGQADNKPDDDPDPPTTEDPDPPTTEDPNGSANGEPNIYDDPRGGIFAEFQASYDRSNHPFQQADAVCLPHTAAADRVDTDPGISADTISIAHIRSRLEDTAAFGFYVPVGDPALMFETLVDYINNTCGGIRGRMLDLHTIEVPILGQTVDEDRNAACIEATEDHNAVITMNSSGFQGSANLCLVEAQQSAFISTQGQPLEWMERGEGRLVSISNANEESLKFLLDYLLESGVLEGAVVGVAMPDTPGQPESVNDGLVQPLRDAGIEVIADVIGCGGGSLCSVGVTESVSNMRDAGITVFFNVLNILSAPGYIAEMAAQGFQPGDVQFYASDFNSQTSELVSGQITNDPAAGALYNGATMVDYRSTGDYRSSTYNPTVWQQTCADVYNENNPDGNYHKWQDQGGDSSWGMVASVCSILRIAARAIYDAGDNPTIADVQESLRNLGPIDLGPMTPASVVPGKTQSPDAMQSLNWEFPCEQPYPYTMNNGNDVCVTGNNDWWPISR